MAEAERTGIDMKATLCEPGVPRYARKLAPLLRNVGHRKKTELNHGDTEARRRRTRRLDNGVLSGRAGQSTVLSRLKWEEEDNRTLRLTHSASSVTPV